MNTLIILLDALPTTVNQTYEIWNLGIMETIREWKNSVSMTYATQAVHIAWYLCALFAILWCGARLYPVIAGDERLSVLPILRPFVIGLVLMYWTDFVYIVGIPGREIERHTKDMFDDSYTSMRTASYQRFSMFDQYLVDVMGTIAEAEKGKDAERNDMFQSSDVEKNVSSWNIVAGIKNLGRAIAGLEMFIVSKIKLLFFEILQYLSLLFLNVVVCGVLFMQAAGLTIMAFIGPLAFAFSCVDAWKQSWAQWTARFFSISLWSGLAYFVCTVGTNIMESGIRAEIAVLEAAYETDLWTMSMLAAANSNDNFMFVLLCLFVAFGMIIIFPVSTWVVQTSGGSAVTKPFATAAGAAISIASFGAMAGAGAGVAAAAGGSAAGGQSAVPRN